jgi:hypothetical protein
MNEKEQEKNKSEDKMKKEPMYVLKEDLFVGRSLYDSFNYFNHIVSHTSGEEYHNLIKTLEFGIQLLPDPTKKEDRLLMERICGKEYFEEDAEAIIKLYDEASKVLANEVLSHPSQKYQWGDPAGQKFPEYFIDADDVGKRQISCSKDTYDSAMTVFRESQYDGHLPALRNIKNMVFNALVKFEIIPRERPTFKEVMEKTRIENYKKRHAGVK